MMLLGYIKDTLISLLNLATTGAGLKVTGTVATTGSSTVTASGTITTASGAATDRVAVVAPGASSIGVRVAPAWTSGTLLAEGSVDGTNFDAPLVFENPLTGAQSATITPADASVTDYLIPNAGMAAVRVRATAIALGGKAGAAIVFEATSAVGGPLAGQLPAALGPATPALSLSTVAAKAGISVSGQKSITGAAGAAALAATTTYPNGIQIRNLDAANTVYIGLTGVVDTTGFPIKAGETWSASGQWDPSTIFLYAPTTLSVAYLGLS